MISADVSARPALATDAAAIANIQHSAWAEIFSTVAMAEVDLGQMEVSWEQAITSPPDRRHRVFVACAGPLVVGFTAVNANGVIVALEVGRPYRRQGHGSRLLAACVDTYSNLDVTELSTWFIADDVARENFFRGAGFAQVPGFQRTSATPDREITELFWRTRIA